MDITGIARWNFEADDDGLLVCRGLHESGEHCEAHMERLSPHEALEIMNAMRSRLLHVEAGLKMLTTNGIELTGALKARPNDRRE